MRSMNRMSKIVVNWAPIVGATILALPVITSAASDPMNDDAVIESATSAAPAAIGNGAKVIQNTEDGEIRTVREGTNNFTCMADNPASPGNDPMCLDENAMEWAGAWMAKTEPPSGKIGFIYMLQGGSDASNLDPFATEPADGEEWVDTGPHVMIMNYGTAMTGYPDQEANPDTSLPYVMWGGTPYAHLMIPVAD